MVWSYFGKISTLLLSYVVSVVLARLLSPNDYGIVSVANIFVSIFNTLIAGVIRGQFPYLAMHINRKKEIYERYKNGLKDLPIKMNPYISNKMEPNFWLSCMTINKEAMCKQSRNGCKTSYI